MYTKFGGYGPSGLGHFFLLNLWNKNERPCPPIVHVSVFCKAHKLVLVIDLVFCPLVLVLKRFEIVLVFIHPVYTTPQNC